MIRIYSSNKGTFDIPDTLLQALGTLVGQRFAAIQSVDFDESESAPVLETLPRTQRSSSRSSTPGFWSWKPNWKSTSALWTEFLRRYGL
jgi:hypothetical protein